jgi:hypothetical protein
MLRDEVAAKTIRQVVKTTASFADHGAANDY